MRKIVLFVFLALVSCSKTEEAVQTDNSLQIVLKTSELDFYGIPNKSLGTILVGDMIKVKLEITKLKGADFINIKPVSKSITFHELLNTDYELYTLSTTEKDKFTKVESLLVKQGVTIFYVKPLVAGTFQIKLEEETKAFDIATSVVFTAVKIVTSIEKNTDRNCGLNKWHRNTYWFSIDAGMQTFDLLYKDNVASYSYETAYRGTSKIDSFSPNTTLKIIEDVSDCGKYPAVDNTIKSITITKTIAGTKELAENL